MKVQLAAQTRQTTTERQVSDSLLHKAVPTVPVPGRVSTAPVETHFGHDFSQTALRSFTPTAGPDYGTVTCPVFPRTCPFGGACHTCPARASANAKPALGTGGRFSL